MNSKNTVVFNKSRFTFYSEYSFKFEYSPDRVFINKELFVTDINEISNVKIQTKEAGNKIEIFTEYLHIIYKDKGRFSRKNLIVKERNNKSFKWYYGKKDKKNLGGTSLDLYKFPEYRGKKLTEGVISRSGWYVYEDDTKTYWNRKKDWVEKIEKDGYITLFFIGYGNNYNIALEEFSKIFGRAPMVPQWAFGFWYSRYYNYHQDEYVKLVKEYRKRGIPIDVMVVDTDWRQEVWNGYDWAKKYFPAPDKFIKSMKKQGVKITLNDHPGYDFSEVVKESDSHFKRIKSKLKLKDKEWRCNWMNKKEVKVFVDELLKKKLKAGIDFWWVDGWGADGILSDPDAKKGIVDGMVSKIETHIGLNPQMWLNLFYYKSVEEVHKKRGFILSRWGGIGSHRYPAWFSGDTYSNFNTLKYQVYFTYTAGNVLTNYWSHDIGGFLGKKISKELFIRWFQFGALSPIFRTHSDHGVREPWNFDSETVEIFKKYTLLRYKLFPYFYRLSFESYKNSMPLIRGMYHLSPENKNSYKFKYQYMLGDSILVAPVVKSMKRKKLSKKKIFFPEGEWIAVEKQFVVQGENVITENISLSEIPFFVKKGSIIPIVPESISNIDEWKKNNVQFDVFMDKKSFSYVYYEDDGVSDDYKKGRFAEIPVEVNWENNKWIITLGKLNGSYKNMRKVKNITMILHFADNIKITGVKSNNKKLAFKPETKIFGLFKSFFNSYKIKFTYNGNVKKIEIIS